MFEIAIDELGIGSDKVAFVQLPANKNAVIDAMDREKIYSETFLRIAECNEVPELNGFEFSKEPTLDELNFLAKRIKEISEEKTQIIAYRALLQKPFETINEAVNRTFDLDSMPVFPCKNYAEYGEIVLENDFLEELEDVPDELYELLDAEKVGRVIAEREGGVFVDGYYVVTSSYEPALVYDEELPERMEDWIFRLEVAKNPKIDDDISKLKTEILTLPADENYMNDLAGTIGEKRLQDAAYLNFQSSIPQIDENILDSMEDIFTLNDIAKKYAELSREDRAKFKAILEFERCNDIEKIGDVLNSLDDYEFDFTITDASDFGINYLSKLLPPDIDRTLLDGINAAKFAFNVMSQNRCMLTDYGVISERGGHLYTMVETSEQQQNNNFEMGGIS